MSTDIGTGFYYVILLVLALIPRSIRFARALGGGPHEAWDCLWHLLVGKQAVWVWVRFSDRIQRLFFHLNGRFLLLGLLRREDLISVVLYVCIYDALLQFMHALARLCGHIQVVTDDSATCQGSNDFVVSFSNGWLHSILFGEDVTD